MFSEILFTFVEILQNNLNFTVMKTIQTLAALTLASSLIFTTSSCNKENDNKENESETILLPEAISFMDDNAEIYFSYDEAKRFSSMEKKSNGKREYLTTFQYDEEGKVIKRILTDSKSHTITYNYIYLSIDTVIQHDNSGNPANNDTIILDSRSNIVKHIEKGRYTHLYKYNPKGNVEKITEYNRTYNCTFDNQKGIYSNVKTPKWAISRFAWGNGKFSINNIFSATGPDTEKEEYEYNYNESGYPSTLISTYTYGPQDVEKGNISIKYKKAD